MKLITGLVRTDFVRQDHRVVDGLIWCAVPLALSGAATFACIRHAGWFYGTIGGMMATFAILVFTELIWDPVARAQRLRGTRKPRDGYAVVPRGQVLVRAAAFGESDAPAEPLVGSEDGPVLQLYGHGLEYATSPTYRVLLHELISEGQHCDVVARWRLQRFNRLWRVSNLNGRPRRMIIDMNEPG